VLAPPCSHRSRRSLPTRRSSELLALWAAGPAAEVQHLYQRCQLGQLQAYLTLNQHDTALQAALAAEKDCREHPGYWYLRGEVHRSEEHTSELQSRENLVCHRLPA